MTTTEQSARRLGRCVEVEAFTREEARTFLEERTSKACDADADALITDVDGLPLALAQIAATGQGYAAILAGLKAYPVEEALPHSTWDSYPRSVAAAVLMSAKRSSSPLTA